jgi:hypothetical protein
VERAKATLQARAVPVFEIGRIEQAPGLAEPEVVFAA